MPIAYPSNIGSGLQVVTGPLGINLGAVTAPTMLTVGDTVATSPRGIMSWQSNAGTDGARLHFRKSRGTFGSPAVITSGDMIGRLVGSAYDGANFLEMASIDFVSSGTIANTRVPTEIRFFTATDAAPSVLTQRMVIDNQGRVGIGRTPLSTFEVGTNSTRYFSVDSSNGRVTVGPATNYGISLQVAGPGNQEMAFFTSDAGAASIDLLASGSTSFISFANNSNGRLKFRVGSRNAIVDLENNTVRIGLDNYLGSETLSVQDRSNATSARIYEGATQSTAEVFGVYASNKTTPRLVVTPSGVGISTTSPGAKLHVTTATTTDIIALFKGAASQSGDLLQCQDSNAKVLAKIDASGDIYRQGLNAQALKISQATTQSGAMSGATLTLTNLIPAGSLVIGVTIHPTTSITSGDGGTTYSVGDGTDVDRWGAAIAFANDVTLANITIASPVFYTAATSVVLTCDGGKTFSAGVVRVTVHYISLTAATS